MTGLRPSMWMRAVLLVVAAATIGSALWWLDTNGSARVKMARGGVDVGELLSNGGDAAQGYARALQPATFVFPRDHGAHPDFRNEWWYFTGNLRGGDGGRYGFQLTVFRFALSPRPRAGDSAWGTRQAYMAHLALTDAGAGRFRYFERFSRGAAGLAGARSDGLAVWLEDWSVTAVGDRRWRLRAAAGEGEAAVSIDLTLEPAKPVVLQGDRGLSRKGSEPGNASYYYSLSRLAARGTITAGGTARRVEGSAWLDREWSTSVLEEGQIGWDWFAVQLDDGRELMYYQLRRADGTPDAHSQGVWVETDGTVERLGPAEVQIDVLERWRSPRGGEYPSRWRVRVPQLDLDVELRPLLADQELDLFVRYWEGAVDVRGYRRARPVSGWGYVELTGYSGPRQRARR